MDHENLKDPISDLIQRIENNKNWYKNVEISLVIVKEKDQAFLFDGKAIFVHKNDENKSEITYDYGHTILARRIFQISEFLSFLKTEPKEVFDFKDLTLIHVGKGFNTTVFRVPSNTEYVGMINPWASRVYRFGGDSNTYLNSTSDFLVKPECPSYPNLHDALYSFLESKHEYHDNHVKGLQIILPDYSARIKTIQVSEKNVEVEIETLEVTFEGLILKISARRDKDYFLPDDIKISQSDISIEFPFEPKSFYIFLVNKNNEEIIDYIEYGNYMTSRHRGIIIKTSSELIEELIVKGENKNIEFKREMSEQFLESVSAFANTDGGKIILGVDNQKNIVGIYDDFATLEKKIRGIIRGNIQPQIEVNVELIEVQQRPVVIVTVPEGSNKPYLQIGKLFIRNNEDDVPMGRSELDTIYHSKKESRKDLFSV